VNRWLPLSVVALALALRLSAAFTLPLPLGGDAGGYDGFAQTFAATGRLLDTDGTPLTYRPPGYPFFVGTLYAFFGRSPVGVAAVQALLDSALVGLIFLFCRRRFSERAALIASALYAISPAAVFASGAVLSESVGTSMLVGSVMLAVLAAERNSLSLAASAGVLGALLTLTRSVMVLFPGVVAASFLVVTALGRGRRWGLAAMVCVGYLAALTPWLARNHAVLGVPTLSTNSGDTLYASWVHPPGSIWGNNTQDAITAVSKPMPALEADRYLFKKAVEHVKEDPMRAAKLLPEKVALLLAPWDYEVVGRGRQRSWNLYWPVLAVLGGLGLSQLKRRGAQLYVCVWLAFASLLLTSLMFYGSPRFREPFEVLLVLPAALTVEAFGLRRGLALSQTKEAT
jgi:4-amino-4-deoxy-L-arabinose transferase-like glycosyltransferase